MAVGGPDVDRVPRHVSGRVGGGHPSGGLRFRAVLRDRLAEQLLLVLRGAPAAVDVELDPVVRGIGRSLAQGPEQVGVEVGDTRDLVVEDRRAVGDGTVGLAERATASRRRGRAPSARERTRCSDAPDGRHRGRRRAVEDEDASSLVAEGCGDRRDDDEQAGDADPCGSGSDGSSFVLVAVGHACQSRQRGVAGTYAVFDTPTICAGS